MKKVFTRHSITALIVAGIALSSKLPATAQIAPTSFVSIGTLQAAVPIVQKDSQFLNGTGQPFTLTSQDGLAGIKFSFTADTDPFITYAFAAFNNTNAPVTFDFAVSTPIVSTPAGTLISHTMSGSISAGDGDGVTISNSVFPVGTARGGYNGALDPTLEVGNTQTSPMGTTPYPNSGIFYASTNLPTDATSLNVEVNFTLTGGGDVASITGLLLVPGILRPSDATPEPSSIAFLATSALTGAAFLRRRKLARQAA